MHARTMRWVRHLCFALGLALSTLHSASADPAPDDAKVTQAKQFFSRGSELFVARRYSDALDALQASYKLAPSPNSGLLIARCLRALGKPVEAMDMFTTVETEARRRVAGGEAKYGRTATSAAVEGAEVRAGLGSLRIRVDPPIADITLVVDGTTWQVDPSGMAVIWHVPGEAHVSLQRLGSSEQKQVVTVPAGGEVQAEFGGPVPVDLNAPVIASVPPGSHPGVLPVLPPPPESVRSGAPWAKPASIIAGVVTAAGIGVFAGFGLASHNEYNEVAGKCGADTPRACNTEQQGEAQTGKTDQLIANIGLGVGSVAAAATLTFVVIALTSSSVPNQGSISPRVRLGFGSAGLEVPW
jgi:hypothetical protein